jgi:hypothetical protein
MSLSDFDALRPSKRDKPQESYFLRHKAPQVKNIAAEKPQALLRLFLPDEIADEAAHRAAISEAIYARRSFCL